MASTPEQRSDYIPATALAGIVIVLILAALLGFEYYVANTEVGRLLENGDLSDTQRSSLDLMLDLVTLFMNWSIAVIGAVAYFLKLAIEKPAQLRKLDLMMSFGIILLAVSSLFFGHLVIDDSIQLLAIEQFPVTNDEVRMIGRLQYGTGLSAIALFGFHVFQYAWAQRANRAGV